jgi:hypothetical protein
LTDSFMRIDDSTSALALVALLAGLVSLAFGLPTRSSDELSNPVLEDLLAAQVGVLLVVLVSRSSANPSDRRPTSSTTSRCCWRGRGRW